MSDQTEPRCQECESYGGHSTGIVGHVNGQPAYRHECKADPDGCGWYTYGTDKPTRAWFCPRLWAEGEREQET